MMEQRGQDLTPEDLRSALYDDRFVLLYQPQFGARDGRIAGVEGLVRLKSRSGEPIGPGQFIAMLERSGLIHEVGLRLFARGCTDALLWPDLTVAINVSPVQFRDPRLAERLVGIARDTGIDPGRIEIEVTEGLFFDDPDLAGEALRTLRDAGFSIALDDFGTGYSSLAYLLRFPVNKIKIDRSFVIGLPGSLQSVTIIQALIALSRALGLKVVAEGVETEAQRLLLRTAGCHLLQGFLFSEAIEAAAIASLDRAGAVTAAIA